MSLIVRICMLGLAVDRPLMNGEINPSKAFWYSVLYDALSHFIYIYIYI